MAYTGGPDQTRVNALYIDNAAAPAEAPFHIVPSAAPTGTQEAGDLYFDSTSNSLKVSNGTAYANAGGVRTVKTAAATLTAADSGALCLFNAAAGFTYTLPDAVAGLHFKFVWNTTVTSSVARIACATGDFFIGTVMQGTDGTFTIGLQDANGTTHLAYEGNGTTTGGSKGDWLEVVAISGTQWAIWGMTTATGSEASPFKTS